MNVLAIDTSHANGSVAALTGGRTARRMLPVAGEHARLLAAAVADAAAEAGFAPGAADLVAVVRGPGSFTGLRVGVTTAKALAWASGARLVGVSAAHAIARQAAARLAAAPRGVQGAAAIHVVFDAGRGQVHAVTVAASGDDWLPAPGSLATPADWLATVPPGGAVVGPGLPLLADTLAGRPDVIAIELDAPLAETVAAIALDRVRTGATDDPAALVPDYIRPSYAEEPPHRP